MATTITPGNGGVTITIVDNNPAVTLTNDTEGWLNSLTEYISDEAAIAAGLTEGDWYKTAQGHMSAPAGIPKQVKSIT